ncbi:MULTISPECIES: pyridoxal phosphate-dependent aminotransferase [unclassified Clostridioides]|uniref:pyridoxal phosphate-dependent aminotransferase n=1 Tax=unclassified Clostridioides TaxID=2635829 RepID=UPI001D11FBEB|nr:pyridoxal phosphate-dependent aminotransferase [Clostridioides sp. ZZV14-6150]MCC0660822.1 pyridoxal phosphate-dependent aminotransferase [Clostridioides sp. ZZV14-6154]MCC0668016.1 pyridoxal phosphate-dependent aminotransferase [Clostridioides sp. ZZV14-6153]MCC0721416.1 pyridoxal phosphate-dependent aminotransferase [Clostridioides sp. ZZV14-6104]MCC0729706.1 pyridoxal phosphate-dependent aminotransferase [Clostridioides sp. ZZV14-6048]MCC0734353.1 pyridoxal phosphate-dependent aminotrans
MISNKMQILVANSSVIRAMFEEGKKLSDMYGEENVFDFSIGNPSVEPPETIKAVISDILNEESPNLVHGYMNNSGYEDVRDAIAKHINKKDGLNLTRDNLIMTCGAAGGLNIILKTLLNPDDEVIAFAPYFGEYKNYTENYDGKLIEVPTNIETFEPDLDALKNAITPKTRALIINTPNNPTGVIYSEELLKNLGELLDTKQKEFNTNIYLISDEPYREIIYDGAKVPCILKYYKNSFIGYSYSKSLSLPGERIGYIVANGEMDDFDDVMSSLNVANRILGFVNAPSLFQRVIARSLDAEVDVNIYKKNFDLLYNSLIEMGFSCVKPSGTFYLFPKAPIEDDKKFCADAKQFNLLLVPGSSFGCPGHFRVSYCVSYDKVKSSLPAFEKLAKLYNLK